MSSNNKRLPEVSMNQIGYRQRRSVQEILVTADNSGQLGNIFLWDSKTGSQLAAYKGGVTAPNTLCYNVGNTYLLSACPNKPLLNVWLMDRREQRPQKQTTPGKALQALAASPGRGKWIVGSVDDRIYLWQSQSGKLLAVIGEGGGQGHYQDVTHLAFTDDGSHIISAGKDGAIIAWGTVAAALSSGNTPPRRRWPGHSLAVTGLKVGPGGWRSGRVFSCSLDQMAKVHDLWSGDLLLEVTFGCGLTSISIDLSVTDVYVGCSDGTIKTFSLLNPPRDVSLTLDAKPCNTFSGHKKAVRLLSVSIDGTTLVSGSDDNEVKVWHIPSKQCCRTLPHKGSLTAAQFAMPPLPGCIDTTDTERFRPSLVLAPFEKTLFTREDKNKRDKDEDNYTFQTYVRERVIPDNNIPDEYFESYEPPQKTFRVNESATDSSTRTDTSSSEVDKLREANLDLYQFAVSGILGKQMNGTKT